jgi:hypothetical protein
LENLTEDAAREIAEERMIGSDMLDDETGLATG